MRQVLRALSVCLLVSSAPAAADEATLQIRFYPARAVRPYEVDPQRGLAGALLQNAAIVNRTGTPVTFDRVEIDLLSGEAAAQTQRLSGPDLEKLAAKGAALQKAGLLELYAFQFRAGILLGPGVALAATPRLEAGSALHLGQRSFVFSGRPDAIRVRAFGRRDDGAAVEAAASIPIVDAPSKVAYAFPLAGRWFIAAGQALHHHHRWVVPEEFALDIVRLGDGGSTHGGDGSKLTDYLSYGAEVRAAADGVVVSVEGSIPDTAPMPRRPGEAGEAYLQRIMAMQNENLAKGFLRAAGNHVVIEHAGGEHSFYAHLQPGSLQVRKGDLVKRGAPIGRLGNSGNTTEPHLHFHVVDGADPILSAGLPVRFEDVTLPLADAERAIQSGDIVEAR